MNLLKLLFVMLRRGKFRFTGTDHVQSRRQALTDLPARFRAGLPGGRSPLKAWMLKNPYRKAWLAQAALVKSAFKSKGGHLSAGEAPLAYIRIPRAASTALSHAMLTAAFPDLIKYRLTPQEINFLADAALENDLRPEDVQRTFLAAVRNPFSRIASFYRGFFEQLRDERFIYEDYLFGIFKRDLSFEAFLRTLQLVPDALKDQHIRPQHCFLRYYERKHCRVEIFKLEDDIDAIRAVLATHGLTMRTINRADTPYDYRHYYDRETLEIVRTIYATDISRFGYESEYERLRKYVS